MASVVPVGIDLGTSFCAVSYLHDDGRTHMIPNADAETLTHSVVHFGDEHVTVGGAAWQAALHSPDRVADNAKRDMGALAYRREIAGQRYPPEVIQSCLLRRLRRDIAAAIGENFQAVITVPAYFDEARRKATCDAAIMSGLPVLDIVNEPTAAALAFGERLGYLTPQGAPRGCLNVLVYDLGGGTFDVTVIRLAHDEVRTLATDGDCELGGLNWDQRLADHAREKLAALGMPMSDWTETDDVRLLRAARTAKHDLSDRPLAMLEFARGDQSYKLPIARDEFEDLTADLLERTIFTAKQALLASGLIWKDVDRLILVGGSSRMPAVRRAVKQMAGIDPDDAVSPDEAVARGAAIYAQYLLSLRGLSSAAAPLRIVDVNAHSLGIEGVNLQTLRTENVALIRRNSPLPCEVKRTFVTRVDNQPNVRVRLLEGESSIPGECSPLATAKIKNLPQGLPKGTPIEVRYSLAANGRLAVTATMPSQGEGAQIELQRVRGLEDRRVQRWQQIVCRDGGFRDFHEAILKFDPPHAAEEEAGAASAAAAGGPRRWFTRKPAGQGAAPPKTAVKSKVQLHAPLFDDAAAPNPAAGAPDEFEYFLPMTDALERSAAHRRRERSSFLVQVVVYVLGAVAGIVLAYQALRWMRPDLNLRSLLQTDAPADVRPARPARRARL
jgi:molecular chaperone DnaK